MSKEEKINPEKLLASKIPSVESTFSENQAILYALSIGFNQGNNYVMKIP